AFVGLLVLALAGRGAETPPLILISLDAFRWDYCDLHPAETPNLRRLMREGVTARGLIPVFPSNTFPNHYSIVTGLYPSHHGIINNQMFDPGLGAVFRYNQAASSRDDRWWGGEPIWITAVKQQRPSAVSFWSGSEAAIGGLRPTFWKPYAYDRTPFDQRLEEVVGWLRLPPEQRPAIIVFYLEETNAAGHTYGPGSPEVVAAVKLLDGRVGALAARLAAEGIVPNLVIVSDHGMTSCDETRVVIIDDYIDLPTIQIDFEESCAGLRPLAGTDVEAMMRAFAKIPPAQAKAYRAADLPARFHVDPANPRVPPVWIVPAEGWNVVRRSLFVRARPKFNKGQHGYDNAFESMRGIFIAHGPSFKSGAVLAPVENVHVYNLLCAALGLASAPNDGDDRLVKSVLR
ncbi:MAG: ectonucleotide pyrophosphatase/phosphodiesterase, partial [Verrucomicrobia bacterium]|nr:ectonucleotide pyrophosphatase/phosphodiesterase [Verrucomicrobiota bacterium]